MQEISGNFSSIVPPVYLNYTLENLDCIVDDVAYTERWVDIIGFEGLYMISDFGRIKSVKNELFKINKQHINKGYLYIDLYKNNKRTKMKVHRLVGIHFIPNTLNKPEINHIECNKKDNRFMKLEWATSSENKKHLYINGFYESHLKGKINSECVNSKPINQLTLDGVIIGSYSCSAEAERKLRIKGVRAVCRGDRKSAGGFKWSFK